MDIGIFIISTITAGIYIFLLITQIEKGLHVKDYLLNDWRSVLPRRLLSCRIAGVGRVCLILLCIGYYLAKTLVILFVCLSFRLFKFAVWDIWNWVFKLDRSEWYKELYSLLYSKEYSLDDEDMCRVKLH